MAAPKEEEKLSTEYQTLLSITYDKLLEEKEIGNYFLFLFP